MSNAALLLAGGKGSRMQGTVEDKTLALIAGKPVIRHSIDAFIKSGVVNEYVVVYRDSDQRKILENSLAELTTKYPFSWVLGGAERQDSVFNGLSEVSLVNDYVFIHDCARPLIRPETLRALADLVRKDKAVCLGRPVNDTIKRVTTDNREMRRCYLENVERRYLWAMETPQVFDLETILECYRRLRFDNIRVTDDTAAFSYEGKTVSLLSTGYPNIKLTTPDDIPLIEFLLRNAQDNQHA